MMAKGIPDPRDMRKHDLIGPFGLINYRLLESAMMVQALADADAMLFLQKNFAEMFNRWAGWIAVTAVCRLHAVGVFKSAAGVHIAAELNARR